MPKIPSYDNFTVAPSVANYPKFQAPEVADYSSRQLKETGQSMMRAGESMGNLVVEKLNEANKVRVDEAVSAFVDLRTNTMFEALSLNGRNALYRPDGQRLPDEFDNKLGAGAKKISESLGNPAQRKLFDLRSADIRSQMRVRLEGHILDQNKVYTNDTQKATINTAVNQAVLLWGDEGMRKESTDAINKTLDDMAKYNGWDPVTVKDEREKVMGVLHAGVMEAMFTAGNTTQAKEYYANHSAEMSMQLRANMHGKLKAAGDAEIALAAVEKVWKALGPTDPNQPIKIYDIERQIEAELKGNPDALSKAKSMARERTTAFNAQQSELKAGNTNAVWAMIDAKTPIATVMSSREWLALPEKDRHDILKAIDAEAYTKEARLAAIAQRNASDAARNDAAEVRQERRLLSGNAAEYLTATDPDVLRNMSRAGVEALRVKFGREPTQQLLNKWDALQKPGAVAEAKMDQDDFNHQAEQLGLRPYDTRKTEEEKAALGELKYRMEQLIHIQQTQLKRTLTRDEKQSLMQQEMSRTVLVDPGFFSAEKAVPVIRLSAKQIQDVQVPPAERVKIVAALKEFYAKNPNDPRFAPTEENVKRLWVSKASPNSARLIGNGK